jgi:serine/threonine-protein kinase
LNLIGKLLAERYHLTREIGSGGMGVVYAAVDQRTKRELAIKVMSPAYARQKKHRERFQQEPLSTAKLKSDHVVEVLDHGIEPGEDLPFFVMELLEGATLGKVVEELGKLEREEVLLLLWQAGLGLTEAHAANIVHRDLKPDNLFLTLRDDSSPLLKIVDFGIAKDIDGVTFPQQTGFGGTPLYMPPEQIHEGELIDQRADLYALGQVAFTLLTGHAYLEREGFEVVSAIKRGLTESACKRAARWHVTLPQEFDAWFRRAVALEPDDRFQSAAELVTEFARAFGLEAPEQCRRSRLASLLSNGNLTRPSREPRAGVPRGQTEPLLPERTATAAPAPTAKPPPEPPPDADRSFSAASVPQPDRRTAGSVLTPALKLRSRQVVAGLAVVVVAGLAWVLHRMQSPLPLPSDVVIPSAIALKPAEAVPPAPAISPPVVPDRSPAIIAAVTASSPQVSPPGPVRPPPPRSAQKRLSAPANPPVPPTIESPTALEKPKAPTHTKDEL